MPLLPVAWQHGETPRFSDAPPMPREPYGYAHVTNNAGLLLLRNPWIACQSYRLKLDESLGFSPNAQELSAVSLYPEPRLYGERLKFGDVLEVPLAPYETLVLALKAGPGVSDVPQASTAVRKHLNVQRCERTVQRVAFSDTGPAMGPDWTCRLGDVRSAVRVACEATIQVKAPQAKVLILYEGEKAPPMPLGRVTINGRPTEMESATSVGWCATGMPHHEQWNFQMAPLAAGENVISLEQFVGSDCTRISAWVWATKPGASSTCPDALPQPESISLDGVALVADHGRCKACHGAGSHAAPGGSHQRRPPRYHRTGFRASRLGHAAKEPQRVGETDDDCRPALPARAGHPCALQDRLCFGRKIPAISSLGRRMPTPVRRSPSRCGSTA